MQATKTDKSRQSEPGKILHELRFGEASAAGENPFAGYYGGVDSTALFVFLAGSYFRRTGDEDFIRLIWPNLERALSWITDNMDRYGGFIRYSYDRNGLTQQCWKDSADSIFDIENPPTIAQDPIAVCEVQAYAFEALKAGQVIAGIMGMPEQARAYGVRAAALERAFNEQFWVEDMDCYAMALDGRDRPLTVVSSNAGHCLLSAIVPDSRAGRVAERLMRDDSFSGYGIRTLAVGPGYDPLSYHRGSVWPHDTAMVALGMRQRGFSDFSNRICDGLLKVYSHAGRIPELFSGDALKGTEDTGPRPYPASCLMQAWAAAAFISLMLGREDLTAS
jgi:glycogen debranching enzyme